MGLDLRKMQILEAIIDDYILTASPVGSRTISRRSDIGLSSATIRNEMFDLKELGLLEQPHTSSGSMPSDKAYRLYVNSIMHQSDLTTEEMLYIKKHFSDKIDDVEDVVKQTAVVLSQLTNCMSMVMAPQLSDNRVRRIQIIPTAGDRALLVIVTDSGLLRDSIITIPQGLSEDQIDLISRLLTSRLSGYKLRDVTETVIYDVFSELGERRGFLTFVHSLAENVKKTSVQGADAVKLHGRTNLLYCPEYHDIERAREMLSVFEQRDRLYDILAKATNVEFSITIGSENEDPLMRNCSIVTATYKINDDPIGSLGIIGPTRMNYSRVLAVLKYMGRSMSEMLTSMYADNNGNKPSGGATDV